MTNIINIMDFCKDYVDFLHFDLATDRNRMVDYFDAQQIELVQIRTDSIQI